MTTPSHPKRFSMIREFHLADWFTLGNAVCGVGALFSTMTYLETSDVLHVYFACALVLAALIFDVFDGRIARWRQKSSAMGFDVQKSSPALFTAAMNKERPVWERLIKASGAKLD